MRLLSKKSLPLICKSLNFTFKFYISDKIFYFTLLFNNIMLLNNNLGIIMRILLLTVLLSSQIVFAKAYFLPLTARENNVELIGDCISVLNPLFGVGMAFYHEDLDGLGELLLTEATSIVSTELLKIAFNNANFFGYQPGKRPNGSSKNFPSGHVSTSFAASQFVFKRYGAAIGLPMTMLSIFTGFSRIFAKKHDFIAVFGGAAIGIFSAEIFVKSFKDPSKRMSLNFDGQKLFLAFQFNTQ